MSSTSNASPTSPDSPSPVPSRGFASDNNAGIHPEILDAIVRANTGHVPGYGHDPYTESALKAFRRVFGEDTEAFFVFNGTAANVLSLAAATRPFHSVLCAATSHIHVDECGAPEKITGAKLVPVAPATDGKLSPELLKPYLHGFGVEHHSQPRVISISQTTELGTVYRPEEIRALAELAHGHGMILHMDGARVANAAAALGLGLRELTRDLGVDILSFGGTKNGLMGAEAVVFLRAPGKDGSLAPDFKFVRKQSMQLASKMRFLAVQFEALLANDLWLRNARHANAMAALLARELASVPGLRITRRTEANAVFASVPREAIERIRKKYFFHVWDEAAAEVRWMTAFDTTEQDVREFVSFVRSALPGA